VSTSSAAFRGDRQLYRFRLSRDRLTLALSMRGIGTFVSYAWIHALEYR